MSDVVLVALIAAAAFVAGCYVLATGLASVGAERERIITRRHDLALLARAPRETPAEAAAWPEDP